MNQCLRQDVSNFSKNAQMNQSDPIYLFDVLTEGHFLVTNDSNISHIITEGQGNATSKYLVGYHVSKCPKCFRPSILT